MAVSFSGVPPQGVPEYSFAIESILGKKDGICDQGAPNMPPKQQKTNKNAVAAKQKKVCKHPKLVLPVFSCIFPFETEG